MKVVVKKILKKFYLYLFYNRQGKDINPIIKRRYIITNSKGKKNITFVALGDSLTYGFGASNYKKTFPYIISKNLSKKFLKIKVINLAVCGAKTEDILYKQLPVALRINPDFVTILIGTNDVHNFININKFKHNLENIIIQLKKNSKTKILVINIPYLISNYMTIFPYNILMDLKIKQYNRIIHKITKMSSVSYYDLYINTKDYFKNGSKLYSTDGYHPSDKGYKFWGNLINTYLNPFL